MMMMNDDDDDEDEDDEVDDNDDDDADDINEDNNDYDDDTQIGDEVQVCEIGGGMIRVQIYTGSVFESSSMTMIIQDLFTVFKKYYLDATHATSA